MKGPISYITQSQYVQLIGLLTLAKRHIEFIDAIAKAMREITMEEDTAGHCMDAIYSSISVDDLLKRLKIAVLKKPAKRKSRRAGK